MKTAKMAPAIMDAERVDILRRKLDEISEHYDASREVVNDPVHIVMKYEEPADREIAAFLAAVFAYGNVKQIQRSIETVFSFLGPHPAALIRSSNGGDWKRIVRDDFKHRFNTADDLRLLLTWLGEALRRSGTIENFFAESQRPGGDLREALDGFVERLTKLPSGPYRVPKSKGALFFVPRPSGKSACKRLLLFLRWVAGTGPQDLALWTQIPRSQLIIPVDTHVLRIARHLGLTKRKDNTWRTAEEITEGLKLLDPEDPTRFDFAICHLGISKECPSRYDIKICGRCRMNSLCLTYQRKAKKAAR